MRNGCFHNPSQFVWYMPNISLLLPTHKEGTSNQSVPGHVKLTISNNQSKYSPCRKQLLMRSSIWYCNSIVYHEICVEAQNSPNFEDVYIHTCEYLMHKYYHMLSMLTTLSFPDLSCIMDSANWRSNTMNFLSMYPSFLFWTSNFYPRHCKVLSHQTNDVRVHLTESSHDTFVSPIFGPWNDVCNIIFHQAKDMSFCQLTLIITHLFCHVLVWDHQYHFRKYNEGSIWCALALEFVIILVKVGLSFCSIFSILHELCYNGINFDTIFVQICSNFFKS